MAASAESPCVKASSATTPQLWMKVFLMNHDNDNNAIGNIYYDEGSNTITYMLNTNENWDAEWSAMYQDKHIEVLLDGPAHLASWFDVIRKITEQSVHFNHENSPKEEGLGAYGLPLMNCLGDMTFAQYKAILNNPELGRFMKTHHDFMHTRIISVYQDYRTMRRNYERAQAQLDEYE